MPSCMPPCMPMNMLVMESSIYCGTSHIQVKKNRNKLSWKRAVPWPTPPVLYLKGFISKKYKEKGFAVSGVLSLH